MNRITTRSSILARTAVTALLCGSLLGSSRAADAQVEFRSHDGTGNNAASPAWGAAGAPLLRRAPAGYADGVSAPAGADRSSARMISNAVSAQLDSRPNAAGVSNLFWQWGQFLDHDIDLSGGATTIEPMDISVPAGDGYFDPMATGEQAIAFSRSAFAMVGEPAVREQLNDITAFVDASNVYGSDAVRAQALRATDSGGKLRMGPQRTLPLNTIGLPNAPASSPNFFLAGDIRANEQTALTTLHTLFVREHNRIARRRALVRRTYRAMGGDASRLPDEEERYQVVRALVAAEMQAITYNEFLPVLLGPDALSPYAGYRPDVNPGIANIFSTAGYRFGHTMVSSSIPRRNRRYQPIPEGDLPLLEAFFAPHILMRKPRLAATLRGMAGTLAEDVDTLVVDDLRNFLFGLPGEGGLDLAALNIQRGRDHGLPSYNLARVAYGMEPAKNFAAITSDPQMQAALAAVYPGTDAVDVWVGGLAEDDRFSSGLVGDLLFRIIADQFERLRDGDRFFYASYLPPSVVSWVEKRTLARIIRKNSGAGREFPDHPFRVSDL